METRSSKFFDRLYIIDVDNCEIPDKQMNSFVFCGDSNWDYYFERLFINYPKEHVSEIKNVFLHQFKKHEDMNVFLKSIPREKIFDIATEKDFYTVLQVA